MTREPGGAESPQATIDRLRSEVEGLQRAMRSRAVIEQAKGLLAARLGCSPDEAFDWLARRSQQHNRKLIDLAAELLGRSAPPAAAGRRIDRPEEADDQAGADPLDRADDRAGTARTDRPAPRAQGPGAPERSPAARYHLASAAFDAARSPDELVRAVRDALGEPVAATVALFVLEPDGALRLVGSHGLSNRRLSQWQRLPPQPRTPSAEAVRTGSPVWRQQEAEADSAAVPGRTVCALPLRTGDRSLGALVLGWADPLRPDPQHTAYLAGLAALCADRLPPLLPAATAQVLGEPWFRAALDVVMDPVMILRPVRDTTTGAAPSDLRLVHANVATVDLAGRTAAELTGARFTELYPGLVAAGVLGRLLEALASGQSHQEELEQFVEVVGGAPRAGSLTLRAVPFLDGLLVSWRPHDRRRRREAQLEQAQSLASLGTWHWQAGSSAVDCSPECARLLGHPGTGHLTLTQLEAAVLAADRPAVRALVQRLLGGELLTESEFRIRRADGVATLRAMAETVGTGPGGTVAAIRGVVQDITAGRATERALTSARAELAEQRRRTADELRAARSLQQVLLAAPRLPALPGVESAVRYLPAGRDPQVGGDWYDLLALPGGELLVVVGDASGHGLPAAAAMAQLRYALRGLAFCDPEPQAVLERLNRMLFHQSSDYIATVLCGRLDPAARTLRWARAGHPPPVLLRAGVARVAEAPAGLVIGATPDAEYVATTVKLEPAESLLLYTDGLTEHPGGEPGAGLRRLLAAAQEYRAPQLAGCLDHILRRLGGPNPRDDTCLLGLRVS
ncbi:SpoIIE family protein phosphatase [Kitasatospora nipponensis]|uniref:SpoIIE family protein phosphatase n=1 Tax=Kitasatospora nipponensis TaxID=258049 RepID=A0ABN1WID4_9ACTN